MKDDKLHRAINELPEFQAPEIWDNIEKILSNDKNLHKFWFGLSIVIISGVFIFVLGNLSAGNRDLVITNTSNQNLNSEIAEVDDNGVVVVNEEQTENTSKYSVSQLSQNNSEGPLTNLDYLDKTQLNEMSIISIGKTYELIHTTKSTIIYIETGENLVNNSSFEDFTICPKGIVGKPEKRLIPFWDVPSKGTPDYFNICSTEDAGVPQNFAGKMNAHSGDGYCGMILRQNFTRDNKITGEKPEIYREYIQTELKSELVSGKKYRIKFWVCNSSNSRFAVDAIGACVTGEKIKLSTNEVMNYIPIVENPTGKFMMNQNYWIAIEGIYEAQGGEMFLTIGNFTDNFSTNYIMQNGKSDFNYAYYYIDDVSVTEVSEELQSEVLTDTLYIENSVCLNSK